MRNLPLPSRDKSREQLKKSIYTYMYKKVKHGHNITDDEIDGILDLYDSYDNVCGVAKEEFKGGGFAKSLREAVKLAYNKTYEGNSLHSIRTELFANAKLCPICGIEPPTDLDHHLPESVFQLLSIYIRNLVPLCHKCNKRKLAGFEGDDRGGIKYMHAYLDILPDAQFLQAEIIINNNNSLSITFGIDENAGLSKDYLTRMNAQITKLELNSRYQKEVNSYLSGHAVTLQTFFQTGGKDVVKRFLAATAKHERNEFYRNHWRPTLLDALAAHDEFTDGGFARVLPVAKEIVDDFLDG